jgi:pyruvate kinase
MRNSKRTKIICTIGPACEDPKILTQLVKNGMNVARLNFSHGTHENHAQLMATVHAVAKELNTPVAVLQDLQGPKIRMGKLPAPVMAKKGQKLVLGTDILPLDFDITHSVEPKQRILIEDGLIELRVDSVKPSDKSAKFAGEIYCTVIAPGEIKQHKGVNLPDSTINFPIFTSKDLKDLEFGVKNHVDYVALSFVRSADDIVYIKKLIDKHAKAGDVKPLVVAKIELGIAVENFDSILDVADVIMVARGDLGVEVDDSKVPVIQKHLIHRCNEVGKPVIVATQMLDSMIRNPRPTRAEVSDVANAVIDKADAVMLSGESAFGDYPVEAVSEMNRIIITTEDSPYDNALAHAYNGESVDDFKASLIANAVQMLSLGVEADAIIGTSESGYTARFVSRERPETPIIIMTDKEAVYRQMALTWGVTPLFVKNMTIFKSIEELLSNFIAEAKMLKYVKKGDTVVLVAGQPLGQRMNLVQTVTIK